MADDKHYVPGSYYRIDDMTGFKVRVERTRKQWNNIIVREESWESRQPQDFVKGVRDDQAVPEPRPRQTDTFLGPLVTFLTAAAVAGATHLAVDNTGRMYPGDTVTLPLDNGNVFTTIIGRVIDSTHLQLFDPLSYSVSNNVELTDWSAVSPPNINSSGSGGDD